MTREEFDRWIGCNRPRLMRVARKMCGQYDAADAVQAAIERIYRTEGFLKTRHAANLVAYFSMYVRNAAKDMRRSREREARKHREFAFAGPYQSERGKRTSPARRAD